jgi:hypothetical protein
VTKYLDEHLDEAHRSLIEKKIVQIEPQIYMAMTKKDDLLRSVDVRPDRKMFERLQDELVRARFQDKKVDVGTIIDETFLPGK